MARLYERKFLNKDRGMAAIEIECSSDDAWIGGSASISDCNRKVTLDFGFGDARGKRKALTKIDTLIASLMTLRKAFAESQPGQ